MKMKSMDILFEDILETVYLAMTEGRSSTFITPATNNEHENSFLIRELNKHAVTVTLPTEGGNTWLLEWKNMA